MSREIIRRADIESLRAEFGSEYIISELIWFLHMEVYSYTRVPPGGYKRGDDRGLSSFQWDLGVQSSLMDMLRVMHNWKAEERTSEILRMSFEMKKGLKRCDQRAVNTAKRLLSINRSA